MNNSESREGEISLVMTVSKLFLRPWLSKAAKNCRAFRGTNDEFLDNSGIKNGVPRSFKKSIKLFESNRFLLVSFEMIVQDAMTKRMQNGRVFIISSWPIGFELIVFIFFSIWLSGKKRCKSRRTFGNTSFAPFKFSLLIVLFLFP